MDNDTIPSKTKFDPKPRFEAKPLYNEWEVPVGRGRELSDEAYRFARKILDELLADGYSLRDAGHIMYDSILCAVGEMVLTRNIKDRAAQRKEFLDGRKTVQTETEPE